MVSVGLAGGSSPFHASHAPVAGSNAMFFEGGSSSRFEFFRSPPRTRSRLASSLQTTLAPSRLPNFFWSTSVHLLAGSSAAAPPRQNADAIRSTPTTLRMRSPFFTVIRWFGSAIILQRLDFVSKWGYKGHGRLEATDVTSRERFRETMRFGTPDRVPYFEEGLRDDVLERWHEQGLPKGADLAALFHTDGRVRLPVNIEPIPPIEGPLTSRADFEELRRRLDPDDPKRFPDDWPARVAAWRASGHVLELQLHRGFFLSMGVHEWRTFEPVVYLLHDDPRLVHDILNLYGEFGARLADRVLSEVDVDCAIFSEPIGGNDGPLLSPQTYGAFVLPSYRPILDAVRRRGIETLVYVTYANSRPLIPSVVRAGFNCLWACEVNVEAMDYIALRQRFGRDLRLIGGIDLDTLLQDKAAIRREMERVIPPLLAQGGYVPLADGRVRANVPFENYRYYRQLLESLANARG